jgi:hypothetical protein
MIVSQNLGYDVSDKQSTKKFAIASKMGKIGMLLDVYFCFCFSLLRPRYNHKVFHDEEIRGSRILSHIKDPSSPFSVHFHLPLTVLVLDWIRLRQKLLQAAQSPPWDSLHGWLHSGREPDLVTRS